MKTKVFEIVAEQLKHTKNKTRENQTQSNTK